MAIERFTGDYQGLSDWARQGLLKISIMVRMKLGPNTFQTIHVDDNATTKRFKSAYSTEAHFHLRYF